MLRPNICAPGLALCLAVYILVSIPQTIFSDDGADERLIGWRGETYSSASRVVSPENDGPWIETISWAPRAFIYHKFLTPEECDHLISLATPKLSRSMVVGENSDLIDPIRTSYSAGVGYNETAIVGEIEERIARWTHLPRSHQEPMEILRYINGQKYDAHWDWFDAKEVEAGAVGGMPVKSNRMATVLMYLSDVDPAAGGETALPLAEPLDEAVQGVRGRGYSECASWGGLSVRPKKGDVLLFWDMDPGGGTTDRHALHASCPTFNGTKWTATKWIHNVKY